MLSVQGGDPFFSAPRFSNCHNSLIWPLWKLKLLDCLKHLFLCRYTLFNFSCYISYSFSYFFFCSYFFSHVLPPFCSTLQNGGRILPPFCSTLQNGGRILPPFCGALQYKEQTNNSVVFCKVIKLQRRLLVCRQDFEFSWPEENEPGRKVIMLF